MAIKKSIGWTEKTINPIKGMCKGGCWYCWTKGFYKRNFLQPKIRLDLDCFFKLSRKPKRIFLCSTHDLFGGWIPSWWRTAIFERIESNPQHTFQILTKYPQNIKRDIPSNVWLGVSITEEKDMWRYIEIRKIPARILFISYEPLIGKIESNPPSADWIIIGRLTGHGNKYNPKKEWIQHIINRAKGWKEPQPIFLKNNLKSIWGENLIQEMPNEGNT